MKPRYLIISLCMLLMAAVVFNIGASLRQERSAGTVLDGAAVAYSPLVTELGPRLALSIPGREAKAELGISRDLQTFYGRRAYAGGPPWIPHPLQSEDQNAGACLNCHRDGGYVAAWKAYTPVTPHPEFSNCRQCHVPQRRDDVFVSSNWAATTPPAMGFRALPGSPPAVPHGLQLRENCAACHTGPGAVKELRTTHPERVNCRQCHMVLQTDGVFGGGR